jgi:phosphoribosylformimino-5-aminoimidazole carboxamide ribotide isomerase
MEALGFLEAIYTDINRDGTLEGPNLEAVKKVVISTRMGVYASGGISSLEDVKKLKTVPGLRGLVIGKALYAGKCTLEECLKV